LRFGEELELYTDRKKEGLHLKVLTTYKNFLFN